MRRRFWRKLGVGAILAWTLSASAGGAEEVRFALHVGQPLLEAALREHLGADAEGRAVLWGTPGGCRRLVVSDIGVAEASGRLEMSVRTDAKVGVSILGFCPLALPFDGYVEVLARPEVDAAWQLRLRDLDVTALDTRHRPARLATALLQLVQDRLEARLGEFRYDLGPPLDEVRSVLRVAAAPERSAAVLAALATLRPLATTVDSQGVRVEVALDLPPSPPRPVVPEAPFTPEELARWEEAMAHWDAFLAFVVKTVGLVEWVPPLLDDLLAVLLDGRHELVEALAAGPRRGVDPVRQLFLDTWSALRDIVQRAALQGTIRDRALRYMTFVTAGDALAALDAAGPALGTEISADGLRRLARMLAPEYAGDPLAYGEAPDPQLRELFHFYEPESLSPDAAPMPPNAWWATAVACAEPPPPSDELRALGRQVDRKVPVPEQFDAYRALIARLLALVGERASLAAGIDDHLRPLLDRLVPTTAWQESCWRQFVERDGRVTPLVSTTGDVGIMQVNRRVWRGFFDLEKLDWDVVYNAGAGAQILAQLLGRYGAREEERGLENVARATYSAYNGGPAAFRRYRTRGTPRRQRAIDLAFWEKYRAMVAGEALDYVLCVTDWGRPGRRDASLDPAVSTPTPLARRRSS